MIDMILLQNSCVSSVSGFLTSPYTVWLPVVSVVALAIIGILALIYILSPLMGRTDIKGWSRYQIYSILLSLALIVIFGAFSTLLCTVNPENALNSVGLVPQNCIGMNTIYGLSLCDINYFNNGAIDVANNYLFSIALIVSFVPDVEFKINFIPGLNGLGLSGTLEILPLIMSKSIGTILNGIALGIVLNQVQLLLIGTSLLLFAVLMAIGLIARMFGITRTFGGAAIAFAIGLGFVYPMLVAITYGFIDNAMAYAYGQFAQTLIGDIILLILALISAFFSFGATAAVSAVASVFLYVAVEWFMIYIGMVGLGLFLIPFINFVITDIFIIDFSRAIGEKIDLLSMLSRIV